MRSDETGKFRVFIVIGSCKVSEINTRSFFAKSVLEEISQMSKRVIVGVHCFARKFFDVYEILDLYGPIGIAIDHDDFGKILTYFGQVLLALAAYTDIVLITKHLPHEEVLVDDGYDQLSEVEAESGVDRDFEILGCLVSKR